MSIAILIKKGKKKMADKRRILIVMMDGFEPSYLQASDMPNTKQMVAKGFYKQVEAMMPTVTNVNNTGICCGVAPKEHGITAKVEFSWGATEAKVVEGMADAAVEITETGSTIRAHGLRIVCDLLETHTVFFANKKAMADNWKRSKIDQIALLIQAALDARQKVLLKMNVGEKNLDSVVGLLPSLHAPTVNRLAETGWSAVETVVDTHAVRTLIPRLKAAGAEGILELDLKKIC